MHRRCPWRILALWFVPLICWTTGCAYPPLIRPAGPQWQQQQNASLHDPYTDNDLGPEVVGGRPREFQKPLAEPVRSRWLRDSWWTR